MLINAIKININEVTSIIKETYYSKITDFNPRAAKDEVTVTAMCIIKYFYSKKMTKELDLAMIYLCFSGKFYPSIHYSSYPTALPADYRYVCDYVINNKLSNKLLTPKITSSVALTTPSTPGRSPNGGTF